ncbi:MAG: PAS sensor histidine kinase, partial [Halonotius sp. J07HN6]
MSATNTVFVGMSSEDVERIATALENTHGGSQITTFDTPESIAEHLEDRPPDCIVSEYEFSGMDGTELLEIVRNEHPHLPFIFFTASGDDAVANSAFADRVTDYLPKDTADRQFERIAERISEMAKQSKVEKERKQQSSERKHELSLFERVQEIASIGAWNYDVQADEGTLTEKVYDIYGVPRDESLSAQKSFSFFDEQDQSAIRDAFERAVTDGEPYDLNLSVTGADGTNRQVRAQGDPQIEDGTVVSVQGTIQDVTEQADRQRELQLLQQSIDNADVPITLADPTQEDLPLVYVNEAYEELTGYSADEALGRNCRFLQGEDTDPAKVATLREAI